MAFMRLRRFLEAQSASTPLEGMGLVHTAGGEDFIDIIESKRIVPSECAVFKDEKIAYFFLGRPAYKTAVVKDASYWQLPAVFCFDRLEHIAPKRIFPFDSGAMSHGRYRNILGKLSLGDFDFGSDRALISKVLANFFGDIEKYREGKSKSYQDIRDLIGDKTSEFIPLALAKLYNYQFNDQIDDRVRLVELQFDDEIPLAKPNLRGVIICREWLRDPEIKKNLDDIGCQVKDYPLYPLSSESYYSKIYELAEQIG